MKEEKWDDLEDEEWSAEDAAAYAETFAEYNVSNRYGGLPTYDHNGKLRNQSGVLVIYTDGACPGNGKRNFAGQATARSGCGVYGGDWLKESFKNPSSVSDCKIKLVRSDPIVYGKPFTPIPDQIKFDSRKQVKYH